MAETGEDAADDDENERGNDEDADSHNGNSNFFIELRKDGWGYLKVGANKTVDAIIAVIGAIILVAILAAVALAAILVYLKIKTQEVSQKYGRQGSDEFEVYTEDEEVEQLQKQNL